MIEAVVPVHLSGSLLEDAVQDANGSGMSLENWFISLAEDRMRDKQVTERFYSRAPLHSDGKRLLEILDSTNNHPPMPGDELEA